MAQIEFRNVYKRYGKTETIHGINLTIEDGEFMAFVGPSGCGKSTNLRMLAGLESISEGEIFIGERCVNDIPPQNRNIAMVFQNYALYPHKTVAENIVFGLLKQKIDKKEVEYRLKSVAEILQLTPYLDRKPAALSGGQRQRVAMGRAIIRDVSAFLFDEPLSNLDAKLRHSMRTEIRRLHRKLKTTTIYVTHDQIEAMTLADRVCVLREGCIEQVGPPMELYLNPENIFVATFIGSPAMNILDAQLSHNHVSIGADLNLPLTEEHKKLAQNYLKDQMKAPIKLGIRPDFIQDALHILPEAGLVKAENCLVDIVEPLGFEQEVTVKIGEQAMLARLDLRTKVKEEEHINLAIDMAQVHLFDPKSEVNLNRLYKN